MKIYVVVSVYQGVVSEVKGFIDPGEADAEAVRLRHKYEIVPGYEEESENEVQLHEIDVDARPVSVAIRRQIW